jgi:myotubularin-related protein 1/2
LFDAPLSYVVFPTVLTSHQALVEKDWLSFGHPFSDRVGMPNVSESGNFELPIQSSSARSFPSSPVRQSPGSAAAQSSSSSYGLNNYSPIFLQVTSYYLQLCYSF